MKDSTKRNSRPFWLAMLGPAALAAPLLQAQQAPTDKEPEIVVTATKRESTVQSTPISVTAVSGDDIQKRGLAELTALARSVPGISMRTSGPGQTEFEMRGMASTGGNSPTVGFYLDETPLTAPAASNNGKVVIDPNLYDLNRVEVLRGPQGTLYGAGSMGGTIKVVPNPPNLTAFDASAQAIFGATDGGGFNHGQNGMVNLPFGGGTAALRIVGSRTHTSGWIDRVVIADGFFPTQTGDGTIRGDVLAAPVTAVHRDVNEADLTAARASLLWRPTERLSITPAFLYQDIQLDGLNNIDSVPGTTAHYQPFDTPEPFSDRVKLGSLKFQYAFDAFELSTTGSYWERSLLLRQDGAESWQWGLGLPSVYTAQGGIGEDFGSENDKSEQTSAEFRLTSSTKSKFQWLIGYFYQDFESQWNVDLPAPGAAPVFGTGNLYDQIVPVNITQESFFGDVSYKMTPRLTATAGLRRYSYEGSVRTTVSGAVSPTGSDEVAQFLTSEENSGVNPKFTLSFEASENLLLYATAAKGFRPGGGTGPVPTSGPLGDLCEADLQANQGTTDFVPSPVSFGPDEVWNYELGEKMRAFDSRLTVNSAVYFAKWKGVQQNIPLPCGYNYQANAGDAEVYGAELETHTRLAEGLVLSANIAYTHAELVATNILNAGITPGTRIQNVPDWTTSLSLAYRRSISERLTLATRVENDYVGTRTDATFTINKLPHYNLTNFRIGVEADRWAATLFARNVFNKQVLLNNVTHIVINMPTYSRVTVSQPLTFGIDMSYQFGP